MEDQARKKNTAPRDREAVFKQKYAERMLTAYTDRRIMWSLSKGLKLSVDSLRKLDARLPKCTMCNLPARLHLSNRTRAFRRNYANANYVVTIRVEDGDIDAEQLVNKLMQRLRDKEFYKD